MAKENNHFFVTDTASAEGKLNFKIDEIGLLLDLKALIKEYYVATFTNEGDALLIKFNNGQKFKINLQEVK